MTKSKTTESSKTAHPTALIYSIVNGVDAKQEFRIKSAVDLIATMYPGINYWHTQIGSIVSDIAKKDLAAMFPQLMGLKDKEAAIEVMGQVNVQTVKPCDGYEWKSAEWKKRSSLPTKAPKKQPASPKMK